MIRYRDVSGSTFKSLKATKHLQKLGDLLYVRGYVYQSRNGRRTGVIVRGTKGTARFNAFAWGYQGTGPRGLFEFLQKIGVAADIAKTTVFNTLWEDSIGEKWRINLSNVP